MSAEAQPGGAHARPRTVSVEAQPGGAHARPRTVSVEAQPGGAHPRASHLRGGWLEHRHLPSAGIPFFSQGAIGALIYKLIQTWLPLLSERIHTLGFFSSSPFTF